MSMFETYFIGSIVIVESSARSSDVPLLSSSGPRSGPLSDPNSSLFASDGE